MSEGTSRSEIKEILIFAAKNGYAKNNVEKVEEPDGSVSIKLQQDEWKIHDNYFTSEDSRRYHGSMVAFLGKKAMWFCGYSGFVSESADPGKVYDFLKKAILNPEPDFPVRGPWSFTEGQQEYSFKKLDPADDIFKFNTVEVIRDQGEQIYEGVFYGGRIE